MGLGPWSAGKPGKSAGQGDWSRRIRGAGQRRDGGWATLTPAIAWALHGKVGVVVIALRPSPPSGPRRHCQCQIRLPASECGGEHGSAPRSGSDSPSPSQRDLLGPHRETGRQGRLIGLRALCFQKSWAGCLELAAGGVDLAPPCPSSKVPKVTLGKSSPVSGPLHHDVPSTLIDPSDPLALHHHLPDPHCSLLFHFRLGTDQEPMEAALQVS